MYKYLKSIVDNSYCPCPSTCASTYIDKFTNVMGSHVTRDIDINGNPFIDTLNVLCAFFLFLSSFSKSLSFMKKKEIPP